MGTWNLEKERREYYKKVQTHFLDYFLLLYDPCGVKDYEKNKQLGFLKFQHIQSPIGSIRQKKKVLYWTFNIKSKSILDIIDHIE